MLYVRKLLGGESSSVACRRDTRDEAGGGVSDFNICLSDRQKSTERRVGGVERESFERDERETVAHWDRCCAFTCAPAA